MDRLLLKNFMADSDVLGIRWEDNSIIRFLTTVHQWNEVTHRERRKPRSTSTNATTVRRVFGGCECKALLIPTIADDYNNHMNGIDLANQRRAAYTTPTSAPAKWAELVLVIAGFLYRQSPHPLPN